MGTAELRFNDSAPTGALPDGLEPSAWWQALYSRDQRFDGRFFIGAANTKIYCRPVCPAPFSRPNNLAWFACAAAAESAGFRPCRRCRPETSPGTPAWLGTSAIVSRALRLISEGALDGDGVDNLADRVGVGSRQLRRLFVEHLGASPIRIAITHRVHFARNLIEETDLPITKIALSAGFSSIRQFNHALRAICGQSPTELRRVRGLSARSPRDGLVIRLPYRPPLDWPALIGFLKARATPGVELVRDRAYQRTIAIGGIRGIIDVRQDKAEPVLVARIELPGYRHLMKVVERVRRIFDLGADPLRIAEDLSRDRRLKPLLDKSPGLRVPGAWNPFELAVHAVLGQRLSLEDTTASAGRLVEAFGERFQTSVPGLSRLFPKPEDLANADFAQIGLSGESAATLRSLAAAVQSGDVTFTASMNLEDAISRIRRVPGIEENTAHYIAMRAFGEPDAFPSALPGSPDSTGRSGTLRKQRTTWPRRTAGADVSESIAAVGRGPRAESWRPWRAYAAMHLSQRGETRVGARGNAMMSGNCQPSGAIDSTLGSEREVER